MKRPSTSLTHEDSLSLRVLCFDVVQPRFNQLERTIVVCLILVKDLALCSVGTRRRDVQAARSRKRVFVLPSTLIALVSTRHCVVHLLKIGDATRLRLRR